MFAELLKHPKALLVSVFLHAVIVGLIVINLDFSDQPKHIKAGEIAKTVKAEVVDSKQLEEKKKQEDDAKRKKEVEKKKQETKKREAKKKQEAEKKRKADEKRKAELKRKKETEAKKKQEADKKRKADEKRVADEKRKTEEKRIAEEARIEEKRKAEEAKRKEEDRKRKEAEDRRLTEQEQVRKETELKAKLEAEESRRRLDSLREAYMVAIQQKVLRNWQRPTGSGKMPECEVYVTQGPGGIILGVTFGACSGSSETYRKSIVNAVYKAEPLPKPADPALFDRDLEFIFNP